MYVYMVWGSPTNYAGGKIRELVGVFSSKRAAEKASWEAKPEWANSVAPPGWEVKYRSVWVEKVSVKRG